ncbi:MAG: hypothetical protein KF682_15780 [Nitrospira sp.]|nr:hypothetical protein [Nitrospira sp.]
MKQRTRYSSIWFWVIFGVIVFTDNPIGNNVRGGMSAFLEGVQERLNELFPEGRNPPDPDSNSSSGAAK